MVNLFKIISRAETISVYQVDFHYEQNKSTLFGRTKHLTSFMTCWPGRKRGFLGYRGFYFSNFYKSLFSIFTYSEYRKLEFKKSETFEHPCFRYSPIVNIENLDLQKSKIFKPEHPCFRYSPIW